MLILHRQKILSLYNQLSKGFSFWKRFVCPQDILSALLCRLSTKKLFSDLIFSDLIFFRPDLHFSSLKRVFSSFPVRPDHTHVRSFARYFSMMVRAVQIGMETTFVPPSSFILLGTVFAPVVISPDLWLKMANLYDRSKNPQLFLRANRHTVELLVKHKQQLRPSPNVELFMRRTKL